MKKLYLCFQMNSVDSFGKAIQIAKQLENSGYSVYLPYDTDMVGIVNGVPTHIREYQLDTQAMLEADVIAMCCNGDDVYGLEFDIGMASMLKTTRGDSVPCYMCDLNNIYKTPFSEILGDVSTKQLAVKGAVDTHFKRVPDLYTLVTELKSLL